MATSHMTCDEKRNPQHTGYISSVPFHQVFINFAKQQQELVHATTSHDRNPPTQQSTPQPTRTRTCDITTPLSDIPESGDADDDVVLLDDVNVDLEAINDDDDAALLLNQTGVST